MKKTNRVFALAALLSLVVGCAALAVPPAESFNDRAGYALGVHTAVLQSTTSALRLGEITSNEAQGVAKIADQARDVIDTARRVLAAGDVDGANRQLTLAITILQELQAHLRGNPT